MKKIWILIVAAVFVAACNSNPENQEETTNNEDITVIKGKIDNNNDPYVYLTYNSRTDTIKLNDNGEFTSNVMIASPTNFFLVSGNYFTSIYSMPKSKISFSADKTDWWNSLKFTGDDEAVNNYLVDHNKTVQLAGINSENFLYAKDYQKFASSLENLMSQVQTKFDNFAKDKGEEYTEFVKLESERLKLLEGSLVLTYYTPVINSNKTIDAAEQKINSIISSTDINNPEMIQLHEFKAFVQNMMGFLINKKIQDENLQITTVETYANLYFGTIDEYFVEQTVREELYYSFIKDFTAYYGAEGLTEAYNTYKDMATNKERLSELDKVFSEFSKLAKGQPSVNWSFSDIDGNNYSLSDFRGKYVYIDVWASWCGPCKRELPYLESLKTKFAGKNIEIIQISVDENRTDWVNLMQSENLSGIQLYAGGWDNDLCNHFKITGIPRFILLDTEGNIINSNADRPSGNIETVLNNLEGI
ncbi:MAG: hypothetical protein C0596_00895 [Marinilabiliales bacterium]|nr:MAG: hypothetical protein C0596_00895 [Marinilabiliales bacterium]